MRRLDTRKWRGEPEPRNPHGGLFRRWFAVLPALVAGCLFAVNLADGHAATPQSRPNILFLFGDDWAWPHASCLGTPGVKTPAFDRLAREGVLFRNAHAAAPSCSPSRAAILTGQWHWRLAEAVNLHGFIPARFDVYPDLLAKAGYFVGLTGKGYGPGSSKDRPHNAAGPEFASFEAFLAARPKGRPFCYWFGSRFPHRPYAPGSGARAGIDPSKVVVPLVVNFRYMPLPLVVISGGITDPEYSATGVFGLSIW